MSDKNNMREKFNQISKETGVSTKKILDLLFTLRNGEPIENNELIQKIGVSRNAINQVKSLLSSILRPVTKSTQLDTKFLQSIQSIYETDYKPEEFFWAILEDDNYSQSVKLLKEHASERPLPERGFDQFTATVETTARRASLLRFFDDIQENRILFLGDDDFTSVAVASIGGAKKVVVVDIDERILSGIDKASNKHNLEIETIKYDARQGLPNELVDSFDVVFTDPPYTKVGVELFISRAIDSLDKSNKASRIYACYGNSDRAKERFLPISKTFTDSGLMLRWVFDKFNRYNGAESIGSASSLYVAEVTPKTKTLISGNYDKPIYTNN